MLSSHIYRAVQHTFFHIVGIFSTSLSTFACSGNSPSSAGFPLRLASRDPGMWDRFTSITYHKIGMKDGSFSMITEELVLVWALGVLLTLRTDAVSAESPLPNEVKGEDGICGMWS